MKSTDDSLGGYCSGPQRDRRNQMRILLWSIFWALSFLAVSLQIKKEWFPFAVTLAGVIGNSLFGIATILAYRRFLQETDELRRKIEVESLAPAFGVGMVGGLAYWLLVVSGAAPAIGFAFVFALMLISHSVGVLIGRRRYS
ncbi:MAG TPA: hypothetical protein VKK31_15750 [Thermoanaerobaculia bacterium]|nr:hypothetical protein [Thermoanaerobaculia bacterium]